MCPEAGGGGGGCGKGPKLQGDALARGPGAERSRLCSRRVGLLSPTLQWIFFLGLISIRLKYITKKNYNGCRGRRIFSVLGRWLRLPFRCHASGAPLWISHAGRRGEGTRSGG